MQKICLCVDQSVSLFCYILLYLYRKQLSDKITYITHKTIQKYSHQNVTEDFFVPQFYLQSISTLICWMIWMESLRIDNYKSLIYNSIAVDFYQPKCIHPPSWTTYQRTRSNSMIMITE